MFKCNCPHEIRNGCSEPECPHYAVSSTRAQVGLVDRVAKAIADYWHREGFDPSEPSPGAARVALAAQQGGVREAATLPHKESIAREIRRAMLDNPTDESFNARAEKREKIADATAEVILGLFIRSEQGPPK